MPSNSRVGSLREKLPPARVILDEAERALLEEYEVSGLNELLRVLEASKVIGELERRAEKIYRSREFEAVKEYLISAGLSEKQVETFLELFLGEHDLAKEISNIRRARAGRTAEEILIRVLRASGVPCERGKGKIMGYRPDVVVPSVDVFSVSPEKGVAIAVKRTLRERWAEDIDVFKFRNGVFVLLITDPDFNEEKARSMIERGMRRVYIPDEMHEKFSFLSDLMFRSCFRRLSQLPSDLKAFLEGDRSIFS